MIQLNYRSNNLYIKFRKILKQCDHGETFLLATLQRYDVSIFC